MAITDSPTTILESALAKLPCGPATLLAKLCQSISGDLLEASSALAVLAEYVDTLIKSEKLKGSAGKFVMCAFLAFFAYAMLIRHACFSFLREKYVCQIRAGQLSVSFKVYDRCTYFSCAQDNTETGRDILSAEIVF